MISSQTINTWIQRHDPVIFSLLSKKGKDIFFPHGIIKQSEEANGANLNATIGVATDGTGQPLYLKKLVKNISTVSPKVLLYAPSFGLPLLRQAWLKKITAGTSRLKKKISAPIVTAGITHGLFVAGSLFMDESDPVILPQLSWENYGLIFGHHFSARLKTFEAFTETGVHLENFQKVLRKTPGRKKIIILNFPNNPTGYTPTRYEGEKLVDILREEADRGGRMVVIIDDAYWGLNYESNISKYSFFDSIVGLHPNILAVKIDGASKELYAWGLRVGFITFGHSSLSKKTAEALEDKAAAVVRSTVSSASRLSQEMILNSLLDDSWRREAEKNRKILEARYRQVKKILRNKKYQRYFTPLPYNSGYFLCLKLASGLSAEKVRRKLLQNHRIGVITVNDHIIRLSYSSVAEKDLIHLFHSLFELCRIMKTS